MIVHGMMEVSNLASKCEIAEYLAKAKKLLSEGTYDFVPRKKSLQSLAEYGLTISDAKDEILSLVVNDYYRGPKQDYDINRPGEIWEFIKDINGIPFYVKLKIVKEGEKEKLKCLGFHETDFA